VRAGRDIAELAAEVKRQAANKRDYVADTAIVDVLPRDGGLDLGLEGHGKFEVADLAHDQIADFTKIPANYYKRMRIERQEDLLASNVSTWFKRYPAPRMLRMLDGRNRAFLSNSFRPLDNADFAKVILEGCAERNLEVASCELTDSRLYIKAIDKTEFEVPVGFKMGDGTHRVFDVCCPVFIASNSEVGRGRVTLETGIYTRACTNLAWFAEGGMKRTHLGSRHKIAEATGIDNIDDLLSDRTKRKSDEALWMQFRDVLKSAFVKERIEKRVEQLAAAAGAKITGKVDKVVTVVTEKFGLSEEEGSSILDHLIRGGNLTKYGLHAAVTRAAQDSISYDRATDLEYLGGAIVELPRAEWDSLMDAAA
jgi:hypothetical protein